MYDLKNKVQLIGNLGNTPDVRTTSTGKKWARFRMATNEVYRNAQGVNVNETQWHSIVAWGKVAEVVEKQLNKGSEISVEGKLVNRTYTDKSGQKKYITEVVANELLVLQKQAS
ncbi:MAG: single-stranded DNA-binding protein [Candidatus Dadabacteria bacterium]